jgi:large subunit ribosomal protein L21
MFAVLKTGGKQYRVVPGAVLRVERLAAEAGETVQFNEILMLGGDSPVVGVPLIEGAAVQATVIDQIKGDKVIHYVKRRRKHSSQRTKGHRQKLTLVRITEILASGAEKTDVKAAIGSGQAKGTASPPAPAEAPPAKAKKAAPKKQVEPATTAEAPTEAKPRKRAAKKPAAEAQE